MKDLALSLLGYEQLRSRLAFVVCGAEGWSGGGMYPIGLPIRHYDSALKSCLPTSAAQHPDSSA